jgi:hypothetical protein
VLGPDYRPLTEAQAKELEKAQSEVDSNVSIFIVTSFNYFYLLTFYRLNLVFMKLRSMNQIQDAMHISLFPTPLEEVVEDDDGDIPKDIVLAYSVDEEQADKFDGGKNSSVKSVQLFFL